jgi:hypothetical protein
MYQWLPFYASSGFKTRLDSAYSPVAAETGESARSHLAQASKARRLAAVNAHIFKRSARIILNRTRLELKSKDPKAGKAGEDEG